MSKELGWWGRWWKGTKTKQEEMLILKTESRNARGMERDGTLAVLRRETEEKERQQMGYRVRERECVCAFSLLSMVWRHLGRKSERCFFSNLLIFCYLLFLSLPYASFCLFFYIPLS